MSLLPIRRMVLPHYFRQFFLPLALLSATFRPQILHKKQIPMRTWISKILQTLSSGLIIRQSISDAVRPVFFQTDIEDFLYGTHGGTAFVVNFRGRVYALTCGHVFKEFDHGRIFITAEKQAKAGSPRPEIKAVYYPSSPRDAAIGTDVVDICVIEFTDDIGPDFFKGSAYVIDDNTVATISRTRASGKRRSKRLYNESPGGNPHWLLSLAVSRCRGFRS